MAFVPTDWVPLQTRIPKPIFLHIVHRMHERGLEKSDAQLMLAWVQTAPMVPPGDWYKRFPNFILVGEGQYPKSVLAAHMKPWGTSLASLLLQPKTQQPAPQPVLAGMETMELYHGTTVENAQDIQRQGILPGSDDNTWVSTSLREAKSFARVMMRSANNRVDTKDGDRYAVVVLDREKCGELFENYGSRNFYATEAIPASAIVRTDLYDAETDEQIDPMKVASSSSSGASVEAAMAHMREAVGASGQGFRFEEGGCWGMALALHKILTKYGRAPQIIVARKGFVHAYVQDGQRYLDCDGYMKSQVGKDHIQCTPDELLVIAQEFGFDEYEVGADCENAVEIIAEAFALAGSAGEKQASAPTKFKYGTVQAELPEDSDAYEAVSDVRVEIDSDDLDGKGLRIGATHITVRYGIQTDDTSNIEAYLSKQAPMVAKLGSTAMFPPSESSDNAAVLIAPVECPELFAINEQLGNEADFMEPTFDYKPHVTIAYMKPDAVENYVGLDATKGQSFTIREVTVINRSDEKKIIALSGQPKTAAIPYIDVSDVAEALDLTFTYMRSKKKTLTPWQMLVNKLDDLGIALMWAGGITPKNRLPDYLKSAGFISNPRAGGRPIHILYYSGLDTAFDQRKHQTEAELKAFKQKVLEFVTHERIHSYQYGEAKNNAKAKGRDVDSGIEHHTPWHRPDLHYLARPIEITAHAAEAVTELRNSGWADEEILKALRVYATEPYGRALYDRSLAWRTYMGMDAYVQRKRNNPGDVDKEFLKQDVFRKFRQQMVQYIEQTPRTQEVSKAAAKWETTPSIVERAPMPQAKTADGPAQDQDWMGKPGDVTETPKFKAWFTGSKVVDDHGRPLRVYHGTFGNFDNFETESAKEGGAFFTENPEVASLYASNWTGKGEEHGNPHVMPVYLSLKNPKVLRASEVMDEDMSYDSEAMRRALEQAKREGHDGLRLMGMPEDTLDDNQWVAFYPSQIKSAIGNDGSFDPNSNSITAAAEQVDWHPILSELMTVLKPGLPTPEVKIVNRKSNYLGRDIFTYGYKDGQTWANDNTTIELQKGILSDENTLRRILAHELAHHEDFLLNEKPELLRMGFHTFKMRQRFDASKGHGPKWREIAARFNARYGPDFVTPKSDESYVVVDDPNRKPFFVLMHRYVSGKLMWSHATRLSPKMLSKLARYYAESQTEGNYQYRLFMTIDPMFEKSPKISEIGSAYARNDEQNEKVERLWADGEDILGRYAEGKTAATSMAPAPTTTMPPPAPSVTQNPSFQSWFKGSKVVDAEGNPLRVYRGDYRGDLLGDKFKVNRSTSGRFYFTDDPEIASSYSDKLDTRRVEENSNYSDWFRFPDHKYPRERSVPNLIQVWHRLSAEEKKRVQHVIENTTTDDEGDFEFDSGQSLHSHVDDLARRAGGNWLQVAHEVWLESGNLYNEERRFSELLDKAGVHHVYDDPSEARSLVTPVYLAIKNPLDTAAIPQDAVDWFHAVGKSDRSRAKSVGVDQWDKSTYTLRDWVEKLDDDLRKGTTYAWTVVPEKITKGLQAMGYDGIKDTGGKNGGNAHTVWIAFEPNQIKSALGNNGKFDPKKDSILASAGRSKLLQKSA